MPGLSDAKFVMTWRTVSDLQSAKAGVAKTANWTEIGQNSYAVIYDAVNMLVGYWVQRGLIQKLDAPKETLLAANALGARSCGELSLRPMALVANPASEHVLLASAPAAFIARSAAPGAEAVTLGADEPFAVVDQDGHFSSVRKVAQPVAPAVGAKSAISAFGGFSLMVSNLAASRKFYGDVLGLRPTGTASKTEASFTSGRVTISLRQENAVGLVRSLRASGRLNADWLLFAVQDIEATAKDLEKRGVRFPLGIEGSTHGRGALFQDPDGHVLNLWVPPANPDDINYLPVLKRLLS